MGDELLPELGDLVFSVLIGYAGALEFLYVVRHLYHWSCGHMNTTQNDAESLQRLQQRMRNELTEAESKERRVGTEVMKDGVLYKDGFRIDAEQLERDRLKAAQSTPEAREKRKKEIELELRRQKEIEDETRKQLAEAEAKLAEQRKQAAEQLEAQQRAEDERKLLEAERVREEQQKREEEQKEAAVEARKLLERERLREEEERRREAEENERKEREVAEAKRAEEQRRRQQEEEARRAAEEEELKRLEEAELARKAAEEETIKRQEAEIAAARIAAEEEELRRQEEEETARLRAEEETLRRQEEEEEEARFAVEAEKLQHLEAESAAAEQKRAEEEEDIENQSVETEEQTIKLIEVEKQRELEQLRKEIEDSERANQEEIDAEDEAIENERKLLEAERLREAVQRKQELEEWESKINSEEHMEDSVYKNEVYASSNPKQTDEAETLDSIMQLLDAESERNLREKEFEERAAQERLERQKIIEENARKFLEADHEMEELLETVQKQRRLSATESAPQSPVFEEPCVKKTMSPLSDNSDSGGERLTQTVKTQFGQTSNEPYSLTTKPLLFKSISDDTPSFEPQSSFSVQPSEEYDIDGDGTATEQKIDVQFAQLERQEPEGGEENDTATSTQYTEDYLRSLDGIKQRPLVREDGSGRRRAFKKRRSSGSSNSSFDSRASREEEVKMFTSLEEEELQPKKEGDTDFTPITYASEPLLKVKMPRRRHKRSPAKDAKPSDNNVRGSLEMLDEEANTNPWGEVTPEHYKDMPFWKHEKSMSIDEEAIELEHPAKKTETEKDNNARNVPQTAAFEEATHTQNEEAITAIKRQQTKEEQDNAAQKPDSVEPTRSDIQSNLKITHEVSPASPGGRKSASPRLRRSPRIEEMDQYEELWNKTNQSVAADEVLTPNTPSTPSITVDKSPDIAPWRDEYGLVMEGLSDFYDFTASVNPSRSRSTSRQASPASSQPSTPLPKNVEFMFNEDRQENLEVYDDTGSVLEAELTKENVVEFIESLQNDCVKLSQTIGDQLKIVADSPNNSREGSEVDSQNEMRLLVQTLRVERQSRSHSRSPLPTPDNIERSLETRRTKRIRQNDELGEKLGLDSSSSRTTNPTESPVELSPDPLLGFEQEHSKESMNLLVQSLRVERAQRSSRSRSRSPLPTAENLRTGLEQRRKKKIQHNDELFQQLHINIPIFTQDSYNTSEQRKAITAPVISIQCCDEELTGSTPDTAQEESEYSLESMNSLVESLRLQRSRSKSPMRRLERERTPEPSSIRVGIMEANQTYEDDDEHERRSRTPSRSVSVSPTRVNMDSPSQPVEEVDFHVMLNLEASQNRTLAKCSEEIESILAEKQRQVDADALRKLSNASEEIELRTVTPVSPLPPTDKVKLMALPVDERMRQLRCSPTTPDYDRTISQEWSDVQRIKDEMLVSGFKRSTYVGESWDLGSEFVPLREQTARFRRSRSPSPSLIATEPAQKAGERRQVQDKILAELISASEQVAVEEHLGAKPKELRDTKSKERQQYEELRRMNANFQRSRSQSRSPLGDIEAKEVAKIEEEATKRELQDRKVDLEKANVNFQDFSRYLNAGFLDNERRASDSALIQKPEIIVQLQELEEDFELEPENYHHFRRFSLNQEQSIEEYPNDDYVYVSQIEVQTPSGTRTWIREDYYSEDFDKLNFFAEESNVNIGPTIGAYDEVADEQLQVAEDEETDGSEDERQTVVEVDDEIDEDICDFNERGPADESHHEQSECEEAEREMDHYAGRDADDWQRVENIDELLEDQILLANEEGAVGGTISALDYDSDSAAIDEIYDEAIKNRKQSGILRDYDSILNEMQKSYLNKEISADGSEGDVSGTSDSDRANKAANKRNELKLIRNERREREQRYLGDASVAERQSTRLRTRYGYAPQLNVKGMEDLDIEVDLSYTPKREYNWRKNFKIDEDEENSNKTQCLDEEIKTPDNMNNTNQYLDSRKFSLGGESITLFSQGAEGVCYVADEDQQNTETIAEEKECSNELNETLQLEAAESSLGKSKKKKSKKKLRKDSKSNSIEFVTKDDDDSESHNHSSIQSGGGTETDSLKRIKARSRRNSRNSLTNEETNGAPFSPRSSIVDEEPTDNLLDNSTATVNNKKKLKKRKKTKETFATTESDIKEEFAAEGAERSSYFDLTVKVPTASAAVSPGRISINPLATLSPQNSICTPSSSLDYETPELKELNSAASSAEGSPKQQEVDTPAVEARISAAADALTTTPAAATTTPEAIVTVATRSSITPTTTTKTTVDTFDILKDANFYPLF
ncbi:PREDICTED: trichohyalin isoform X1 [Bactrocera latifrons]|uniref:trichohyalin isoform X1 n=1 Tax=Bactrocera latifrons TaxID=174628 RepID=UPI0008DE4F26|nr:PREDICTED: trichohyalin isoform X1 [Bactrocera latifrons]XP_018804946.1 PREDICTED: trichohyalin isoform X1 [Bactrocera latifrons]